jgi:hypothetical protein
MATTPTIARGCALTFAALLCAAAPDPGVHVRVDLERFELIAVDERRPDEAALVLPIATGSPSHPSPPGRYRAREVVRNPGWKPGTKARARGAVPSQPSEDGPMGVAKIPLTGDGFAVHGGANPLVVGKQISLGCVRLSDPDMLSLLDWLERAGALGPTRATGNGELHQAMRRPVAFEVR